MSDVLEQLRHLGRSYDDHVRPVTADEALLPRVAIRRDERRPWGARIGLTAAAAVAAAGLVAGAFALTGRDPQPATPAAAPSSAAEPESTEFADGEVVQSAEIPGLGTVDVVRSADGTVCLRVTSSEQANGTTSHSVGGSCVANEAAAAAGELYLTYQRRETEPVHAVGLAASTGVTKVRIGDANAVAGSGQIWHVVGTSEATILDVDAAGVVRHFPLRMPVDGLPGSVPSASSSRGVTALADGTRIDVADQADGSVCVDVTWPISGATAGCTSAEEAAAGRIWYGTIGPDRQTMLLVGVLPTDGHVTATIDGKVIAPDERGVWHAEVPGTITEMTLTNNGVNTVVPLVVP